jgi:repressor LexA
MTTKHNIVEYEPELSPVYLEDATSRPPLYPQQKKVLSFIERYLDRNNRAPTLTDIREFLGVKTLSTIHWHLIQLEKKGYIKRDRESKGIDLILAAGPFAGAILSIPLVGIITAGQPIDAIERGREPIPVPEYLTGKKNPNDLFCLKVRGNSMIDAYVCDGDTVVCQKTSTANNGDMIVALLKDNTATLKHFYKKKRHILLQPANPEFPPIKVTKVTVQGKVIAVMRKL